MLFLTIALEEEIYIYKNFVMLSHGGSALPNCFACKKGQIFIFCHFTYKLVENLEKKTRFKEHFSEKYYDSLCRLRFHILSAIF